MSFRNSMVYSTSFQYNAYNDTVSGPHDQNESIATYLKLQV